MAKKIIWSPKAQRDRFEILDYWANRNKSKNYSKRLNRLFLDGVALASQYPDAGLITKYPSVRVKVIRDYNVYYYVGDGYIEIATIWDSRRDPAKFKL